MFIEHIEIENFKSFHGTRILGPFSTLNGIVGPNGIGKSNIIDAILFCFGENAKGLRANRLKDVIYLNVKENKRAKHCSVATRFTIEGSEKVYSVKRLIKSSGAEEFYWNDCKRTKEVYYQSVESLGIFAKSDSFVVTPEIVNLLSNDANNYRQNYLEVVSRSSYYATFYNNLQLEYNNIMAELKTHNLFCKETGKEMQKLSDAIDKKKGIDSNVKELNELVIKYYLIHLYALQDKQSHAKDKIDKVKKKIKEMVEMYKLDQVKEDKAKKRTELSELRVKMRSVIGQENDLRKGTKLAEVECKNLSEKESVLRSKLDSHLKVCEKQNQEVEANSKKKKTLEVEVNQLTERLDEMDNVVVKSAFGMDSSDKNEFHRLEALVADNDASVGLAQLEEELDRINVECEAGKSAVQIESEKYSKKEEELNNLLDNTASTAMIRKFEAEIEECKVGFVDPGELQKKRKEYADELAELSILIGQEKYMADKQRKEEGRRKLQQHFKHVFGAKFHGLLKNLVVPLSDDLALPCVRVLKKWQNAFIVDDDETAEKCIEHVRTLKFMRQKFLPANVLRVSAVKSDISKMVAANKVKLVRDCFTLRSNHASVTKALDFVCGNILYVEHSKDANSVAYESKKRYTTVSKDGTFFHKTGKITGGRADLEADASMFKDNDFQKMKDRKDYLLKESSSLMACFEDACRTAKKMKELQIQISQLRQAEITKAGEKQKHTAVLRKQLDELKKGLDAKKKDVEKMTAKLQKMEEQKAEFEVKKNDFVKAVYEPLCKKLGISDLDAFRAQSADSYEQFDKERQVIKMRLDALHSEISFVSHHPFDIVATNEKEKKFKDQLEELNQKLTRAKNELTAKTVLLQQTEERHKEMEAEFEQVNKDLKEIEEKLKRCGDTIAKMQRVVKNQEAHIDSLFGDVQKLFFKCMGKNVNLPMKNGDLQDLDMFNELTLKEHATTISSGSDQRTIVSFKSFEADYTLIESLFENIKYDAQRGEILDDLKKKIEEVRQVIATKEATVTNLPDFAERLQTAKQTEKENVEKFKGIGDRLQQCKKSLDAAHSSRKDLYLAKFEEMQSSFDYYYKLLYNEGGADATIDLIGNGDPWECRVEVKVTVPGKQQTAIDLLSGGEQCMACLALMFAGKSKRVNCMMLDEFDSALDKNNVSLLAAFCRNLTEIGMQFIYVTHLQESFSIANTLIGGYAHCNLDCDIGTMFTFLELRKIENLIEDDPNYEENVERKQKDAEKAFKDAISAFDDSNDENDGRHVANVGNPGGLSDELVKLCADREVSRFIVDTEKRNDAVGEHCDYEFWENFKNIVRQINEEALSVFDD